MMSRFSEEEKNRPNTIHDASVTTPIKTSNLLLYARTYTPNLQTKSFGA
jgi:hypothetical protein